MAQAAIVEAQPRTAKGKKNKALRRAGITPIHVYGAGGESLSLQTGTYDLVRTLLDVGFTTPLTIKARKGEEFVMVSKIQRHPVTETLLHVDMVRISRTERLQASIPLHLQGEAPGAREEGAQLYQDMHAVDVEALPTDLPHSLTVDVSSLDHAGAAIHAGDLNLPPGVSLVTEPDAIVTRIVQRVGETASGEAAGTGEESEE